MRDVWYRRANRGRVYHVFTAPDAEEPLCGYQLAGDLFSRWYSGRESRPGHGLVCGKCEAARLRIEARS